MSERIVLPRHWAFKDITGRRFNRLVVMAFVDTNKHNKSRWKCLCDCGEQVLVVGAELKSGHTKSCGCLNREASAQRAKANSTHGKCYSREYRAWVEMKRRCLDPSRRAYKTYGGRGIKIAASWLHFPTFFRDMGPCRDGMTLDRIDPNGNYEPGNCRWATYKTQARNKRTNRIITAFGLSMTLAEWAERSGIRRITIAARIKRGWSCDRAVSEPVE